MKHIEGNLSMIFMLVVCLVGGFMISWGFQINLIAGLFAFFGGGLLTMAFILNEVNK